MNTDPKPSTPGLPTGPSADPPLDLDPGLDLDLDLDRELTAALRPVPPPAGFADRVLARAQAEQPHTPPRHARLLHWRPSSRWAGWAVAAGVLAGVVLGGDSWQRHVVEQRRVALATAQFETSQRITEQALSHVREQIAQAGISPDTLANDLNP